MASASSAVSTHVIESGVINAPADTVWSVVSDLSFSWWELVLSCTPMGGGNKSTVGSSFEVSKLRVSLE
jgi:hypothetical protein